AAGRWWRSAAAPASRRGGPSAAEALARALVHSDHPRMRVDGRCHCGAITFEAEVDPESTGICHCTDCQALTGTAFRVTVKAPADRFVLRGKPTVYVKTA